MFWHNQAMFWHNKAMSWHKRAKTQITDIAKLT
jgi:hypothetical protein